MTETRDDDPSDDALLASPVGSGDHVVKPGDCLSSIADAYGFFWKTLWDLPENAALKEARGDPNILLPGDRITVPPLRQKSVPRAAGDKYVFRRHGVPEKIHIKLTDEVTGNRKGLKYELYVEGVDAPRSGVTSDDGAIDEWIPPRATRGKLVLPNGEERALAFGRLDPVNSMAGARARMISLCLMAHGEDVLDALEQFQELYGLEVSGTVDTATQKKLVELYGC